MSDCDTKTSCYGPAFRNVLEDHHVPGRGRYQNVLVEDSANGKFYFYDVCGAWVEIVAGEGGGGDSPVISVNNKVGVVTLGASDVGAVAINTIFFNIKDFGAIGNDTHDDTSAVVAAIAAADTAGGGTVYGPAGTYKLTDQIVLPAGVNIQGAGRAATIFHQTVIDKRAFSLAQDPSNIYANLFMADFSVTGTGTGIAAGIYLEASALWNIWIRDVSAINFGGNGVHVRGAVVSRLEGVIGESNKQNGIYVDGGTSFVTSVSMVSCFGLSNVAVGIRVDRAVYVSLVSCANDFNDVGYYLYRCLSASLVSCGAEAQTTVNYKIEGTVDFSSRSVQLIGCYSWHVGTIGYLITGYSLGVSLIGCFDNEPLPAADYSLQVDADAGVALMNNSWGNPVNINGAAKYVDLTDVDGDSDLNNVNVLTLRDINGNRVLVPQPVADADNYFTIINAVSGNAPFFGPDGPDTDIPLYMTSKGDGDIRFARSDGPVLLNIFGAESDNAFYMQPSATTLAPVFGVTGIDDDISLYIEPKGLGDVRFAKPTGEIMANFSAESATPANRPAFLASDAGNPIQIAPEGDDTDITLKLLGKGDGDIEIGTAGSNLVAATGARFIITTAQSPASATAAGIAGQIAWDANFIYVCIATDTWKRIGISTW